MFTALLILQVVFGLSIIGLVLLQQGKGADMGAAFGAGASGTVFGSRGSGSFFTRATAVLATLFFINSVLLSSPLVLGERHPESAMTGSVVEQGAEETAKPEAEEPASDATDLPPMDMPEPDRPTNESAAKEQTPGADDLPPAETAGEAGAAADKPAE